MAAGARSLNPNKIDGHFVKAFIQVSYLVSLIPKCCVKAFGLILYWVFVYLIYPFFLGFLIAAIGLI